MGATPQGCSPSPPERGHRGRSQPRPQWQRLRPCCCDLLEPSMGTGESWTPHLLSPGSLPSCTSTLARALRPPEVAPCPRLHPQGAGHGGTLPDCLLAAGRRVWAQGSLCAGSQRLGSAGWAGGALGFWDRQSAAHSSSRSGPSRCNSLFVKTSRQPPQECPR